MSVIGSPDLAVFVVWQPVMQTDDFAAARQHATTDEDGRVRHYFDAGLRLGRAYAAPLDTPYDEDGPLAWDVLLLFERGARWTNAPPRPRLYRFPMDRPGVPRWDPAAFAHEVQRALTR